MEIEQQILLSQLCDAFRLNDVDYPTTVKLTYIYECVVKDAGDSAMEIIKDMRRAFRGKTNYDSLDDIYNLLKITSMSESGRYVTDTKGLPVRVNEYWSGTRL